MLTQHVQPLTGLLPSTAYHYRVRSKTALGTVVVSPDHVFKTSRRGSYSMTAGTPGATLPSDPTSVTSTATTNPRLGGAP